MRIKITKSKNKEHYSIITDVVINEKRTTRVYENIGNKCMKRNNRILYYDCTNFFFEIEQEDELRKYGKSKESRSNTIVQTELFMNGDDIPLSFDITSGNTNKQITLKPLEEKIINNFLLSNLVVCTDARLASATIESS